MAKWTGVITNAGNSLLNAWIGEKTLRFDCAKSGTGTVEIAALMAQTDLVSQKQDAGILSAESVDGGIRLKLRVTASQEGYLLNQFGVWASVDGNTALIAIYQHESGVSVPSMDDSPDFVFTFYALIMTSNTGTWTVNIDTSALVTHDDMNSAIAESAKNCLPISGGGLTGELRMNGNPISGLNEPTEESQAVNKAYADKIAETAKAVGDNIKELLRLDGSNPMTGALAMGGNKITGLGAPTDASDAATKEYVDGKRFTATATIPSSDWSGWGNGVFVRTVAINGMLPGDYPHVTLNHSLDTIATAKEEYAKIMMAWSDTNLIAFMCYEDIPTIDLNIAVEVNR